VLFGSNKADRKVRELLLTNCDLQAVVNLPSGVFKPYSGVGTAALIFANVAPGFSPAHADLKVGATTTATQSVWFYDLTADGFSLDDKRTPIEANDIPDVPAKWPGRVEGANSYRVPIEKIRENDWSLAAGRYKPVQMETVKHDPPKKILKEVLALEEDIAEPAKKLISAV
jgi:type I restriction enzyme M protein